MFSARGSSLSGHPCTATEATPGDSDLGAPCQSHILDHKFALTLRTRHYHLNPQAFHVSRSSEKAELAALLPFGQVPYPVEGPRALCVHLHRLATSRCWAVAVAGATLAPHFFICCGPMAFGSRVPWGWPASFCPVHAKQVSQKLSLFLLPWSRRGLNLTLSLSAAEWTTTRRRAVTMTIMGHTYSTGQMALAGLASALRDW